MPRGLWLVVFLSACVGSKDTDCAGEDCGPTDATDPTDTTSDASDTETDVENTDLPAPAQAAVIRFAFTVDRWPNELSAWVTCGGDVVYTRDDFLVAGAETVVELEVEPGVACTLEMEDLKGGTLPAGEAWACDASAVSWEASKGYGPTLMATVTPDLCTLGCTDPIAENPTPGANLNDGSCEYIDGCTTPEAANFDPVATRDDGSCRFDQFGVFTIELDFDNWPNETGMTITCDDTVIFTKQGFTSSETTWTFPVDPYRECFVELTDTYGDDGAAGTLTLCGEELASWNHFLLRDSELEIIGPFDTVACSGCTDPAALNYAADAFTEDGTCEYAAAP